MLRLGPHTVTILRAPLVTDPIDGSQFRDWDNPDRIDVPNSYVQDFRVDDDNRAQREFAEGWFQVYLPENAEIPEHTDRIEYKGQSYEMQGQAFLWDAPDGTPHHVYFVMKRRVESGGG